MIGATRPAPRSALLLDNRRPEVTIDQALYIPAHRAVVATAEGMALLDQIASGKLDSSASIKRWPSQSNSAFLAGVATDQPG